MMKARDNPFNTDRVLRVRYRFDDLSWLELLSRLERLNYRAAIVGPHGSGKTTLLEDLEPLLAGRGFRLRRLRLDRGHPAFNSAARRELCEGLGALDLILFDGAEQLGWWTWRRFVAKTRRAGGLIITQHRPGRLPTLVECRTSALLLAGIVEELLPGAPELLRRQLPDLYRRHRGNLRDALREMYDRYAEAEP
jgi:hypothetical protein